MSSMGSLCAGFVQTDPFSQGTNDMVRAGHTMVFLAFVIALAGIGFRVYFANKRRSNRAQGQPPPAYPQFPFESGVFCPRCGVRSGANYCIGCGYDLQNLLKQVREPFSENRT